MKKFLVLIRPLVVLIMAFSLIGAICGDDEEENSCSDAAKNAVPILLDEFGNNADQICDALLDAEAIEPGESYDDCIDAVNSSDQETMIQGLAEACSEFDWSQSDIDCVADAETYDDLDACGAK